RQIRALMQSHFRLSTATARRSAPPYAVFFCLKDRAPPEIYPLPLHAALPIFPAGRLFDLHLHRLVDEMDEVAIGLAADRGGNRLTLEVGRAPAERRVWRGREA